MTRDEAEKLVRQLMWAIPKFKSNAKESLEMSARYQSIDASPELLDGMLVDMYSDWLFGDDPKNILNAVAKIVEKMDNGARLSGIDFYNVMVVFHRFIPEETSAALEIAFDLVLPEPDPKWVIEWKA